MRSIIGGGAIGIAVFAAAVETANAQGMRSTLTWPEGVERAEIPFEYFKRWVTIPVSFNGSRSGPSRLT